MTTQTEPLKLSTKTINTFYFNQISTQTKPLNISTQSTNTQHHTEINIKTESEKRGLSM